MAYGDWSWPAESSEESTRTVVQPALTTITAGSAPATERAQNYFGTLTLISAVVGFALPIAWAGTVVFFVSWLVGGIVAPIEAQAKHEAQSTGGGGGSVAVAMAIVLALGVCGVLFLFSLAGSR